jgi:CheY-like chemotaxis protein
MLLFRAALEELKDGAGANKRVLLVEDEPLVRMMLEDVLLELGHSIAANPRNLASGLTLARS